MSDQTLPQPKTAKKIKRTPPVHPVESESILGFLWDAIKLSGETISTIVRGKFAFHDLVVQMAAIGVDGSWIVIAIAMSTGAVFALYTSTFALSFGFAEAVGGTIAYAELNELGPVLGGIAFAARSGAAIAAEIGTMVVTEQVDALKAMAVPPVRYLVAPRVLAAVIILPFLTVLADIAGLFGGYLSATASGVPGGTYIASIYKYARASDLTNGLIKSLVFAFLIGIVACLQGLKTKQGATGVGRSTTRSVVMCVISMVIADLFLAFILKQQGGAR